MLQKIRKTADGIIFRMFLGVIVVSFAIWGVSDVAKGRFNRDIVAFKNMESITYDDFSNAKNEEIKNIQRSQGISLSEEQIESMNIDQMILSKLVRVKLLKHLGSEYDLDFSDSVIVDAIKTLPMFRDETGVFNVERFKAYLYSSGTTTEEYSKEIKDYITRTMVLGSFISNSYISKTRSSNIINFMSEKRIVDIAYVSLSNDKSADTSNISEDALRGFYDQNKDLFKTTEIRDICYAKIDTKVAKAHAAISDAEVKQFFEENKAEFPGSKFDKIKLEIRNILEKQKSDIWIAELSKSLVDEVAGGATLQEIADKYKLKRVCEKEITEKNIETKSGGLFGAFSSQINEMSESEVSYPLDLQDGSVVLFEVTKHLAETQQEFDLIKKDVAEKYRSFVYKQDTLRKLQDFASSTNSKAFLEDCVKYKMNTQVGKALKRAELADLASVMPPQMLVAIFASDKEVVVGPFIDEDKAYVFVVRKAFFDKDAKNKMENSKDDIIDRIKEGLMEELLLHIQIQSDMKVKMNPKSLEKLSEAA